ncbi:MAG: DUF3047 domain-containing protein [Candidatus Latescibacteria bacterium]|nr:DUF3047 domain-containing protein [Candidatus Latescibacterota bacterium]
MRGWLAGLLLLVAVGGFAQEKGKDYLILEDFSSTPVGQLPQGWKWRDKDAEKPKPYQVEGNAGRRYLAARDTGSSVILGKDIAWDLHTYPILTWCWRVNALPPGGDERFDSTNDSAAGLYMIYTTTWLAVPRQIKYVWSSTLEEGSSGRRNKVARPFFVVVESGDRNLGHWAFEQVDLVADYRRFYEKNPPERSMGLAVLTDANSTRSYAEAFYAELRVWTREAQERGLIEDYCSCYADQGTGQASAPSSQVLPDGK